jgi:hypothetical protein
MIQPKYISILKMCLIQAFAYYLLLQLSHSVWIFVFMDCLEIFRETLYSLGEASFLDFPECYNENIGYDVVSFMSISTIYMAVLMMFIDIVLGIISTIRIGHKWYWSFLSIGFYMILIRLLHFLTDETNIIYRILLTLFDSVALAVYLNIVILISSALFLYFGKPVVNFIKDKPLIISDNDDILDASESEGEL